MGNEKRRLKNLSHTGYSSLASLHLLPVDTMKIDRSFVSEAVTSTQHRVLIEATVSVARSLHMGTVAEGIETADQAAVVRELGCEKGQGYRVQQTASGCRHGAVAVGKDRPSRTRARQLADVVGRDAASPPFNAVPVCGFDNRCVDAMHGMQVALARIEVPSGQLATLRPRWSDVKSGGASASLAREAYVVLESVSGKFAAVDRNQEMPEHPSHLTMRAPGDAGRSRAGTDRYKR